MILLIEGWAQEEEEVYTFAPDDGEEEVHIFSGRLRKRLLEHARDQVISLIFPEQTLEQLIAHHGLEQPRLDSMTEEEANEPVIVGLYPTGTHILIDGNHRRAFWAARGRHTIDGWAVPYEVWTHFQFNPEDLVGVHHFNDGTLLPQRR